MDDQRFGKAVNDVMDWMLEHDGSGVFERSDGTKMVCVVVRKKEAETDE